MNYRTTLDTLAHAALHVGHGVTYTRGPHKEHGIVRGVNQRYVFVSYIGQVTPKATSPEDLELMNPCEHRDLDGTDAQTPPTHTFDGHTTDDTTDTTDTTSPESDQ